MGTTAHKRLHAAAERGDNEHRPGSGWWRSHWPQIKKLLTWTFFAAVLALLVSHARQVDWQDVMQALRRYPLHTLALAAGLGALSHLLYSCFDLFGRRYTGHGLPRTQVMTVGSVSYAVNLNLGALVGGVAFRYRLYSRLGLDNGTITRVLGLSVLTNWLGYLALAGGVFSSRAIEVPAQWKIGTGGLQALGLVLVAVVIAYLGACAFSKRRSFSIRGHELELPPWRMALVQVGLSCTNWLVIAGVVYVLLQQKVDYPVVVAVLMVSAVAGVLTHIPAGLGVLEAVFVTLLGSQVPQGQLLAALLAYRAVYYLAPLGVAGLLYLGLEAKAKGGAARRPS
jgi:hypothetical protein